MTAAFVAALAVAVVALISLAWSLRRASGLARREQEQGGEAAARLAALEEARTTLSAAESRAETADKRAREAVLRAETADLRAKEAEATAREAEARAGQAPGPATPAGEGGATLAGVVWELERLRCQREWTEVVGPGVGPPVTWDATLEAVLGTELAIVREVIGTPSEVRVIPPAAPLDDRVAGVVIRLALELVRAMARSGEDMTVMVGPEGLEVDQRVLEDGVPPAVNELAAAARAAGATLTLDAPEGHLVARLAFPEPGGR